jgi:hypothetical protein
VVRVSYVLSCASPRRSAGRRTPLVEIHNKMKALGLGLVAALALLVTVGLIGIALVVTASLDDSNRNNLGVGLLTAAGIGLALISIEYAIDLRRARSAPNKGIEPTR